jgi:integrase/recombinase XerD
MKQARTLTDKQLKIVQAHCATRRYAERDRLIVLFSYYAGLRAKEIAALRLDNVMTADGQVRDEFVLTAEQTKGKKARRVFIGEKLREEIARYVRGQKFNPKCAALFVTQKGGAFSANTMVQLFMSIYQACGLDGASSHSGRRTFITKLAAKGVGVRVLAELAAHSSISTTQRYIDVNDDMMRSAVELA